MNHKVEARHGVACALGTDWFGYMGWSTVAKMDDGTLVIAGSGLRCEHVCPCGRTVFLISRDEGQSWSSPRVINDTPLDDRDAGIVCMGGQKLLVSWFISDTRYYAKNNESMKRTQAEGLRWINEQTTAKFFGSWVRASDDGGDTWEKPVKVALTAPHGPIRLASGSLLYFGKEFGEAWGDFNEGRGQIKAMISADGGKIWKGLGTVPLPENTTPENYHEPHVVELPSGKLMGLIRIENRPGHDLASVGLKHFSVMQSESTDGGLTWTQAKCWGIHGSPPHVIRHSSGALVCVTGYRLSPYGQRASISYDEGKTWTHDFVLRDDGPDWDLGYPSTVELSDGSLFTLYYQKPTRRVEKPALLWTRWKLPS